MKNRILDFLNKREAILWVKTHDYQEIKKIFFESNEILKNVTYNSFTYQAAYQPNGQWNFILKGTYDYARVGDVPAGVLDTHRKSFGYSISMEHMPFKGQDLRFFFTYVGRKYNYKYLDNLDNSTNRFMLGMTYRIKAF